MTPRVRASIVLALLALLAQSCDGGATGTGGTGFNRPRPPRPDAVDASMLAVDAGTVVSAPPPALTAPAGSLDAWFAALARAEAGAADGRVLISIFGDSHTAGDAMTGRLRAVLQARFGDAGRGLVAAGRPPYRHYYQRDVGYGSSGTWRAQVGGRKADTEPFGLMGFRVEASRSAEAWVESCASCPTGTAVGKFDVLYLQQPGGGDLEYRIDTAKWQRISTAAPAGTAAHPETLSLTIADGAHRLTVRRGRKGVVGLFGIALERDHPGVVIDGLGVSGRRVGHLHKWDWSVIGPQLARRDPRLVIVQYGTNEADDPDLDLVRLTAQYDEVLARIRAVVPQASVLMLGPPDMAVRAAGKACDKRPPKPRRGQVQPDAAIAPECEWRTPAPLATVIEVQRAAAARAGVAFFDSFAAMGGVDRMEGFFTGEPKLAYGDRVHFTVAGYQLWADALLAELLAAYAASAAATPPAPAEPTGGSGSGG
jgi:lysophospholipase L1-like esterase